MSTPDRSGERSRRRWQSIAPECAAFAASGKFEWRAADWALRLVRRWDGRSVDVLPLGGKAESASRAYVSPTMQLVAITRPVSSSTTNLQSLRHRARCRVRTCDFLRVKQALYH